jgi:AcrR family transcriptional regulator
METLNIKFVSYVYLLFIRTQFMELESQLLEKSSALFMRYGIKSITMDDIAKGLGMSKKTIYQVVDNKADLVYKTMESYLLVELAKLETIKGKATDAVDEMILIVESTAIHIQGIDTTILFDLQKYFPKAFDLFNDYRENHIRKAILENLERGKKEGYYRSNLNTDVISKIYISIILSLFDQHTFPSQKYSFLSLYTEFVNYHLQGILSEKGMKYFENKNNQKQK